MQPVASVCAEGRRLGEVPRMNDRLWKWLLSLASWVILVAGLRAGSAVFVPLLLATFLSMMTYPIVGWLRRHAVPTWVAVLLVLLLTTAAMLGPGVVVHVTAGEFLAAAPVYQERLRESLGTFLGWIGSFGIDTSQWTAIFQPQSLLNLVSWTFSGMAAVVSNALVVLLLMAFMLLEAASLPKKLESAGKLGSGWLAQLVKVMKQVHVYIWVHTLFSMATGVLLGAWVAILGLDGAVLWGFLVFVLNYIPYFGSILAGVPPVLLAFIQLGPAWALLVAAGYLAVNIFLGSLLEPIVMGRQMGLSPLVVLLSIVVWGWVWGPIGMLLGVPLVMAIRIALEESREYSWVAVLLEPASGSPVRGSQPSGS
jgi:AI-2 transport protein TqsA